MPYADLPNGRFYYAEDGARDLPALVLIHSLGTSADLWAPQVPALSAHFRVIRFDTRGHGLSPAPHADYDFATLAEDVIQLMDHLQVPQAHLAGTSMGGMVVLQAALAHPDRVGRLLLCNTAARIGTAEGWAARIALVAEQGLASLAPTLVTRWVSEAFRAAEPGRTQSLCDLLRRTPDAGYMGNCAALRDGNLRGELGRISAPALVISGRHDAAATTAQGEELAAGLANARHVGLEAAHTSNWEVPADFNREVLGFLLETA